jgi:hypothetical protein
MHLLAGRFVFWGWWSGFSERGSQDLSYDTNDASELSLFSVLTFIVYCTNRCSLLFLSTTSADLFTSGSKNFPLQPCSSVYDLLTHTNEVYCCLSRPEPVGSRVSENEGSIEKWYFEEESGVRWILHWPHFQLGKHQLRLGFLFSPPTTTTKKFYS